MMAAAPELLLTKVIHRKLQTFLDETFADSRGKEMGPGQTAG
jgi:hypothetical protein